VLPVCYGYIGGEELADLERAIQVSERFVVGDEITQFAAADAANAADKAADNAAARARGASWTNTAGSAAARSAMAAEAAAWGARGAGSDYIPYWVSILGPSQSAGRAAKVGAEATGASWTASMAAANAAVSAVSAAAEAAWAFAWSGAGAKAARYHARAAGAKARAAADNAAMADFTRLLALNLGQPLELGSPIDLSVNGPLGPLWPHGFPPGLKELLEGARSKKLLATEQSGAGDGRLLSVFIDPGSAPQDLLTEFYLALDTLYRVHGGSGLKIMEEELRSFVGEEALR